MRAPATTLLLPFLALPTLAVVADAAAAPDAGVYERAVVQVVVAAPGPEGVAFGTGTGFFIDDRHIVTNRHVAAGGDASVNTTLLFVLLSGSEEPLPVDLVWTDEQLDLALLEYTGGVEHGTLPLAAGDLREGSEVYAVGYPGSADRAVSGPAHSTLTDGILSRPPFEARWGSGGTGMATVLQHTADINPGNSGGPLLDTCGGVVGVNTGGGVAAVRDADGNIIGATAAQGIFFALHVSELRAALDRLDVSYSAADACGGGPALPLGLLARAPHPLTIALLAGILLAMTTLILRRPRQAVAAGAVRSVAVLADAAAAMSRRRTRTGGPIGFDGGGTTADLSLDADVLRCATHGLSVGRHADLVDRPLQLDGLSRRHFRISIHRGRVFVEDLHSANGTFVNGTRLKPYHGRQLRADDTVSAGAGHWRFAGTE